MKESYKQYTDMVILALIDLMNRWSLSNVLMAGYNSDKCTYTKIYSNNFPLAHSYQQNNMDGSFLSLSAVL